MTYSQRRDAEKTLRRLEMTDYGRQLFGMVQQDAYDAMAQAIKEAQRENALEYLRKIRERQDDNS